MSDEEVINITIDLKPRPPSDKPAQPQCPRCRIPLDQKQIDALDNAAKVKEACGRHMRSIDLRDFYCPDCWDKTVKEVKR